MTTKTKKTVLTVKEFIHFINATEQEYDVAVDGIDEIAVCGGEIGLTKAGKEKFGKVLDMQIDDFTIVGSDEDYELLDENKGNLCLAWDFIHGLAGYCASSDYDRWFEGEDKEII